MNDQLSSSSNASQISDRSQPSSTQLMRAAELDKKQNEVLRANLKLQEEKYKILQEKYNRLNKDYTDLRTNYNTLMSCYNKRVSDREELYIKLTTLTCLSFPQDGVLNYRAGRLLVKLLNRPSKDDLQRKNILKSMLTPK
jgi:hypothetical protein